MDFKKIFIKEEYRSLQDNIVEDFYYPLLSCAKKYQRAVGFFSSGALLELSKGISGLVSNGGIIQIVASPKLSEEDVIAIEKGIKKREEVITENLIKEITDPKNIAEENKLNYLINLIASNILDIKIAILEDTQHIGMYHEKLGLLYDEDGNVVAFSGSMNESPTAFFHNSETIDVFKSWDNPSDKRRVENKIRAFNSIWENEEQSLVVMDFPKAAKEKLFTYRKTDKIDPRDVDGIREKEEPVDGTRTPQKSVPSIPAWLQLREYQQTAIYNWQNNDYVGIFDMATGTGKTYTGLSAVVKLYENRKAPLGILIVCPFQHLVNQWVEDIEAFGMKPIICHSASTQKNWKSRLKNACLSLKIGIEDNICAVFTNATFASDYVQNTINEIKGQSVLVVDEAHYFGAEKSRSVLDERIPYRLALSATIERFRDSIGTHCILNFFGEKCIEYTLKDAIENDMLTRYYYHPIIVSFNSSELEEYLQLSHSIALAMAGHEKNEPSDYVKMLMIKRSRLVASTQEKVNRLVEEMRYYRNSNHILVYCGATNMKDFESEDMHFLNEDIRQVDLVTSLLGNNLGMKVTKFTAEENANEREIIKKEFDEGELLQALIAIRCLDEGVNIPSIQTAFILANSTNPKEYVQRRGRVLRKYPGKSHADVYDFVVSPLPLDEIDYYDDETIRLSKSLVIKEIMRMREFADLAENPSEADGYIFSMLDKYNIELEEDYFDEFDWEEQY